MMSNQALRTIHPREQGLKHLSDAYWVSAIDFVFERFIHENKDWNMGG